MNVKTIQKRTKQTCLKFLYLASYYLISTERRVRRALVVQRERLSAHYLAALPLTRSLKFEAQEGWRKRGVEPVLGHKFALHVLCKSHLLVTTCRRVEEGLDRVGQAWDDAAKVDHHFIVPASVRLPGLLCVEGILEVARSEGAHVRPAAGELLTLSPFGEAARDAAVVTS